MTLESLGLRSSLALAMIVAALPAAAEVETSQAAPVSQGAARTAAKGGDAAAKTWAYRTYDRGYANALLAHYQKIQGDEAQFAAYHAWFAGYIKKMKVASHTNGRAFDIPLSDANERLIKLAMEEGEREKRYRKFEVIREKDHFHVGVSPP